VSTALQQFLNSFNALSDAEKHEAAAEVLRRAMDWAPPDMPDEALVQAAEQLFLDLDAREASNGQP